jgi:hypothetical protein
MSITKYSSRMFDTDTPPAKAVDRLGEDLDQLRMWQPEPYRILNFGAGTQSTTLLYLALDGRIDLDAAIFADTGAEEEHTYEHLEYCKSLCEDSGIDFHIVQNGNLEDKVLGGMNGQRFASMPFFCENEDGEPAMLKRQCTSEHKIEPILGLVRWYAYVHLFRSLGYERPMAEHYAGIVRSKWGELDEQERSLKMKAQMKGGDCVRVDQLFGITTDEITRMREADLPLSRHRYPLIYDFEWSRDDCIEYLARSDRRAPAKSSCYFCPFHDNARWKDMKENRPDEFERAVEFDRKIRDGELRGVEADALYLHPSLQPLDQIDFETPGRRDDGFHSECTGSCGL